MFKCGNCKNDTLPGQPVNYVITVKREKVYENPVVKGPDRGGWNITQGHEIVKQIKACPTCFGTLTGLAPKIADPKPQQVKQVEPRPQFKPRNNQRRDFNRPRKPVDKTNPNWKYKQELDEVRKREAKSPDPRGEVGRKKPIVETVTRPPRS